MNVVPAAAFTFAALLLAACARPADAGDSDDDDGSTSSGGPQQQWSASCPSAPVFTAMTCTGSTEGALCPGTRTCDDCGTVETSCSCVASASGYEFVCNDNCIALCATHEGASSSTTSASTTGGGSELPVSCEAYCAPQLQADCSNVPTDCMAGCADFDAHIPPTCATSWEQTKSCVANAPMSCDAEGRPLPLGCDAELQATIACMQG